MKIARTLKWWLVPAVYVIGGFSLGLIDPQFGQCLQTLGAKPGLATALSVNLLLPLLTIALAAVFPHHAMVWLGAVFTTAAFATGLAVHYLPRPWDLGSLCRSVPPVLVLACLGYGMLGTLVVAVVPVLRKRPPPP